MGYGDVETGDLNPMESVHSIRNLSRDSNNKNKKEQPDNQKRDKEKENSKKSDIDSIDIKGKKRLKDTKPNIKTRKKDRQDPSSDKGKNIDIIIE